MLGRSEPCRGQFSIFEKKVQFFSFRRQKANSVTFCAKIRSDCRIWPNRHWDRVEWTQEMVFNTYHDTRTCLDKKIEIDEKNFQNYFFLTNFLKGYFKVLPEKLIFSKKTLFRFSSKFWIYSWNMIKPLSLSETTPQSWPRNKILWLSDENLRKKSDVRKYP